MSIGLFDFDMYNYCPFPYNLEIMKLSAFYKQNNQIVSLSPGFYPESYTKFIIRKDIFDDNYISGMLKYKNVEYGGYGFTNGIYVPLEKEIELCFPDSTIYTKLEKYYTEKKAFSQWRLMNNASHLRISINDNQVWDDYLKPINLNGNYTTTFIHDQDISSIKDGDLAISDLMKIYQQMGRKKITRVGYKFPIQTSSFDEVYKWYNIGDNGAYKNFQFNGIMKDEELEAIINFLPADNLMKMIYKIDLPSSISEQNFIELIRKIYYQVIFLCNNRKYLTLVIGDNFPFPNQWKKVFDCWNGFMSVGKTHHKKELDKRKDFETLFNYCKRTKSKVYQRANIKNKVLPIEEMRKVFDFIGNFDYELFKDFYTLNSVELKGGKFVCKRRTI